MFRFDSFMKTSESSQNTVVSYSVTSNPVKVPKTGLRKPQNNESQKDFTNQVLKKYDGKVSEIQ